MVVSQFAFSIMFSQCYFLFFFITFFTIILFFDGILDLLGNLDANLLDENIKIKKIMRSLETDMDVLIANMEFLDDGTN